MFVVRAATARFLAELAVAARQSEVTRARGGPVGQLFVSVTQVTQAPVNTVTRVRVRA